MGYSTQSICDGVTYVSVPVSRFKTNELSVDFCLPLDKNTASANALTVSLLSNSSQCYPDKPAISRELSRLYGASLRTVVQKIGENQCLRIVLSGLDDRFSLGDKISTECMRMLLSLIFKPHLDANGNFYAADVEREKRLLIEKIQSEENEKRLYALDRMQQIMFEDEPFAVNKYGTVASVDSVTTAVVKEVWQNMLCCAKIQFTTVGTADSDSMAEIIRDCFDGIERRYAPPVKAVFIERADEAKTIAESIHVKQGKLVMGFRVNMKPDNPNTPAMRAFCDIFGGGPYSKLFANVREKMSLCYYCSARYDRHKSIIIIQCGCEKENMDKAIAEILNQLEEIKAGNFDEELAASRMGLCDTISSVEDDSVILQSWYANQIVDSELKTPVRSAAENRAVTKKQVQDCASLLTLDTVYELYGSGEEE